MHWCKKLLTCGQVRSGQSMNRSKPCRRRCEMVIDKYVIVLNVFHLEGWKIWSDVFFIPLNHSQSFYVWNHLIMLLYLFLYNDCRRMCSNPLVWSICFMMSYANIGLGWRMFVLYPISLQKKVPWFLLGAKCMERCINGHAGWVWHRITIGS